MINGQWVTDARRFGIVLIGAIVAGAVWIYLSRDLTPNAGASAPPSPQVGFAAPDFTLEAIDGSSFKLSDLRGKVVLINLWASWCPPCRAEMPAIDAVYRQHTTDGLVVVGVNTLFQDDETAARRFIQDLRVSFPIVFDRDGVTSRRYRLQAMPTTYIVGRDGLIRDLVLGGPMSEALINSKIEKLLAQP
jgi:peroxiredoxin